MTLIYVSGPKKEMLPKVPVNDARKCRDLGVGVHDPGQAFVRVVDAEKPVPEMGQIESYSFSSQIVHFLDLRVSHGPRAIFGVECDRL